MERLRQLIREIHRRSLWQVLGIYAVASWAVLSVVDTLGGALNLPDWFPALALALLIIGLPIVLATAFVQEGIGGADGAATADPTGSAAEPSPSGAVTLFTWKNAFLGGVGAFAVVGVVATISLLLGGDPVGAGSTDDGERPSIAVIPFENLSADEANAPFARGLHDDLLTQLQKIASVDVLARTTMMQYEGTTKAASTIAAELGVTTILEGGVQRAGDQVRINVQLIDGSTDAHLWAETYTRAYTVENVFEVQSDIARNITASLRATLTPEEQSQIATVPTTNAEAYAAYLAGKAHFVRRTEIGEARAAVGSFEEAVGLDASFGVGWAALAEARSWLASLLLGAEAAAFQRSAQEALDEAVRLAPDAAETQMAQGLLAYQAERDYETAEQHFAAVLSQQPGDVYALYWLGVLEKRQGRFEQARQYYQRAAYLDPMDPNYWGELAFANTFLGLYDEAARNLRQRIVLVPEDRGSYDVLFRLRLLQADTVGARADLEEFGDRPGARARRLTLDYYLRRDFEALADSLTGDDFTADDAWLFGASSDTLTAQVNIALLYWEMGRTDQAVQLAESIRGEVAADLEALGDLALPRQRFNALAMLAFVDAIVGNDGAAHREIEESLALSRATDPFNHTFITDGAVWVYLILGDHDAAISTIETRLDMADGYMTPAFLDIWPLYDPIRDDPRFQALLQR